MSNYQHFATHYDILTKNIPYDKRGEYFNVLIKQNGIDSGILLDLGCGTGTLCEFFAKSGYEVIGVDSSDDMLSCAMDKRYDSGHDILYLNQSMEKLDLYGTIDICISALDTLNHVTDKKILQKAIDRVSLFLNKDGLFIFDVNTIYKHEKILSDKAFVYESDDVYCVWQNGACHDNVVDMTLDFFVKDDKNCYKRYTDSFSECAYSHAELLEMLSHAGLEIIAVYADDSMDSVKNDTERAIYVTKKK